MRLREGVPPYTPSHRGKKGDMGTSKRPHDATSQSKLPRPPATLALFAYAGVLPATVDCLLRDFRAWPRLFYMRMSADALIDRSRARAATVFIDGPREALGDVLVMIDHDMAWQEGAIEHLVAACQRTRGVVGGIYSKRQFGDGVAVRFAGTGEYVQGSDTIAPATYVSTGFMAVHRGVFETLAKKLPRTLGDFYPFFLPSLGERTWSGQSVHEYLSEDWAFCQRVLEAGLTIHADLFPVLHHTGDYAYRVCDGKSKLGPESAVTFSISEEPTSQALLTLMADLSDYSGIAADHISASATDARIGLVSLWRAYNGATDEAAWYRRDDVGRNYIVDLAEWQIGAMVRFIEKPLAGITGKRCLDYGSGIGTWSLYLAELGNDVDFVEPNDTMVDFMGVRAKRMELVGKLHRKQDAANGPYDLTVCWHVMEHLTHPVDTAREIAQSLAPDGLLYTDSEFSIDPEHPMHHVDGHALHGDDIWPQAGLEPAWPDPSNRENGTSIHWWKRAGATTWLPPGRDATPPLRYHGVAPGDAEGADQEAPSANKKADPRARRQESRAIRRARKRLKQR